MNTNNKLVTVTFSGGFHNSPPINARVRLSDWELVMRGESVSNALTRGQEKRLDNHFCGIKDCLCGGVSRADSEIIGYSSVVSA